MTESERETSGATPRVGHRARRRGRVLPSGFATIRDAVSFIVGAIFVGNEVFFAEQTETLIMVVGATMMGLPLAFGADERKRGAQEEP